MNVFTEVQRASMLWWHGFIAGDCQKGAHVFSENVTGNLKRSIDGREQSVSVCGREELVNTAQAAADSICSLSQISLYFTQQAKQSAFEIDYKQSLSLPIESDKENGWQVSGRQMFRYNSQKISPFFEYDRSDSCVSQIGIKDREDSSQLSEILKVERAVLSWWMLIYAGKPERGQPLFDPNLEVDLNGTMNGLQMPSMKYSGREKFIHQVEQTVQAVQFIKEFELKVEVDLSHRTVKVDYTQELLVKNVINNEQIWFKMNSSGVQGMQFSIQDDGQVVFTKYYDVENDQMTRIQISEEEAQCLQQESLKSRKVSWCPVM